MHFLVLRKELVSYFASIKRGATMIINFGNTANYNDFFVKVKTKINNFRKLFDTAIGLRVLRMAF